MKFEPMLLIVDDNMNFVDRMISLLKESGIVHEITVAGNYDEAGRVLMMDSPEIILLDINLPGKNGIEFLKLIRRNNKTCEVIMITNHTDEYYRQQCQDLGARHFLDKSNDFGQVPIIISQYENRINRTG
jgi:DNA-binding NarL/FixJ family response regulator